MATKRYANQKGIRRIVFKMTSSHSLCTKIKLFLPLTTEINQ